MGKIIRFPVERAGLVTFGNPNNECYVERVEERDLPKEIQDAIDNFEPIGTLLIQQHLPGIVKQVNPGNVVAAKRLRNNDER